MTKSQEIHLTDRKLLKVSGVQSVVEFDDKNVVLQLEETTLVISGAGMSVSKLDVASGDVEVSGTINAMTYRGAK